MRVIEYRYTDAITSLRESRRRDVVPCHTAIIRADDLSLGNAPTIEFVEKANAHQ